MKRLLHILLAACILTSCSSGDESIEVKFEVTCPPLPDTHQVYIVGNNVGLGSWDPGLIPMKRETKNSWSHTIHLDTISRLEYKFTTGSWQTEALDSDGQKFQNFTLHADRDTVIKHAFSQFGQAKKLEPTVVGNLKIESNVAFEGLKSRDVLIWTPKGYEESNESYPVLYMHDGQNVFDLATSGFGMEWQVDESCTRLIAEQKIEPMIVVATTSTEERSADYGSSDQGEQYMQFIISQLKPKIDAEFRTKPGREHTYCGGASMGGLISFRMAWEHSDVFSKAICMSPAFQYNGVDYVAQIADSETPLEGTRFYIDNGGVGLEQKLQPGIDAMLKMFKARDFVHGKDYVWLRDPEAEHNEIAWANRFPNALEMVLYTAD